MKSSAVPILRPSFGIAFSFSSGTIRDRELVPRPAAVLVLVLVVDVDVVVVGSGFVVFLVDVVDPKNDFLGFVVVVVVVISSSLWFDEWMVDV